MFTSKPPKDPDTPPKAPRQVVLSGLLLQTVAFAALTFSVAWLVLAFAFWINRQ